MHCISDILEEKIFYFKITIAGINIEVECKNRRDFAACRNYLSEFDSADFIVGASSSEIEKAKKELEVNFDYTTFASKEIRGLENQIIYRKIADHSILYNAVLIHGSVIATNGNAYMITAPSGVGKSTRTALWVKHYPNSFVINGDKPLIKVTNTSILACGTPWCGKEGWNTNTMMPLQAIFLLERADEGEQSSIEELSFKQAFKSLLQQTYRPENPELMSKTLFLLKSLEGKVKFYKFRSTPTEESVQLAYEAAKPR